jgi:hypothetical protein
MDNIVELINSDSSVSLYDTLLAVVKIKEEHNEKLFSEFLKSLGVFEEDLAEFKTQLFV